MKRYIWIIIYLFGCKSVLGQRIKRQTDKHIINQQERMVYKQWDRKKFTPTKGFLGLNYQYWLTWGLHPNYPKLDRRPLSGSGPQTLRMGFVLAMQNTSNSYKKQSDTIRNTAIKEIAHYSGYISEADPLWVLYYRQEFSPLEQDESSILQELDMEVRQYLVEKGVYEWYITERAEILDRLNILKSADLERGSRILGYHRMLTEFRRLNADWENKKNNALKFLSISKGISSLREMGEGALFMNSLSDIEIAEKIINKYR